jgi:hypothetical protein
MPIADDRRTGGQQIPDQPAAEPATFPGRASRGLFAP